ncbi:MAG TPA: M23 family metallopeptidase, partial [Spirochaetales bacterium]|nr:M23 family metallopeptidase [Spirochaetales bacterium]
VKRGARVNQGASVGLIGSTGYSTGVHLHFGVFKNGAAINPLKVLGS